MCCKNVKFVAITKSDVFVQGTNAPTLVFGPGCAVPQTPLEELMMLPQASLSAGEGTPLPCTVPHRRLRCLDLGTPTLPQLSGPQHKFLATSMVVPG